MRQEPLHYAIQSDDEIDLKEMVLALWAGRWWILGSGFVSVLVGLVIALCLSNEYRVSAILAAPENGGKSGLSALAGNLGGLAAMAGINLPGGGGNAAIALAELQSNQLLAAFIKEKNLKPLLFPAQWSEQRQEWLPSQPPGGLGRLVSGALGDPYRQQQALQSTQEPSDAAAIELFRKKILSVTQDKKTELVTISITWRDPVQAASWLNSLVQRLNAHTRKHMMADAEKSIAYLQAELARTQEVGVRQSMYSLMEAKLNGRMMAAVTEEVAFRVIDPPIIPSEPSAPHRALIVLLAAVIGSILACGVILLRHQWRKDNAAV